MNTRNPRLACLILTLALSTADSPGVAVGQADPDARLARLERDAEARYQKLVRRPTPSAIDWYMLGDWCFTAREELSSRSQEVFRKRGEACMRRGEVLALKKLRDIVEGGVSQIDTAPSFEEGAKHREAAEREAREFLDELIPLLKEDEHGQKRIRFAFEQGLERLSKAITPLSRRHTRERLRAGQMPFRGTWIPFGEQHGEYAGFVSMNRLLENPHYHVGQIVSTDILSSAQAFELLGKLFVDGFDEKGNYIVPNFMEDRLALVIDQSHVHWRDRLRDLDRPPAGDGAASMYRVRLLIELRREELQYTNFFAGVVRQMTVFDDTGEMLAFLCSGEDLYDGARR